MPELEIPNRRARPLSTEYWTTFPLELKTGKNVERRGLHEYDSKSDGVGRRA